MIRLLIAILLLTTVTPLWASDTLRVASYNVRYLNPEDAAAGRGWEVRRPCVTGLIVFHAFDLVGVQEATHTQVQDIAADTGLAPLGVGRDDGQEAGEYSPIFYRRERFDVLDSGTFWLSPTPEKVSFGWDALCRRVCTWAKLKERATGRILHFWNTHFDHRGVEARKQAASLLLSRLEPLLGTDEPIVLTGDFNCVETSEPYRLLAARLVDTRTISATPAYGPVGSTNSFNIAGPFQHRIDHIFAHPRPRVIRHGTLAETCDGKFPSDHFPVVTDLEWH